MTTLVPLTFTHIETCCSEVIPSIR